MSLLQWKKSWDLYFHLHRVALDNRRPASIDGHAVSAYGSCRAGYWKSYGPLIWGSAQRNCVGNRKWTRCSRYWQSPTGRSSDASHAYRASLPLGWWPRTAVCGRIDRPALSTIEMHCILLIKYEHNDWKTWKCQNSPNQIEAGNLSE